MNFTDKTQYGLVRTWPIYVRRFAVGNLYTHPDLSPHWDQLGAMLMLSGRLLPLCEGRDDDSVVPVELRSFLSIYLSYIATRVSYLFRTTSW